MTTATVPIQVRRTPFNAPYGSDINASFVPLLDEEGLLGERGAPVLVKPDRDAESPTGQFFKVKFYFEDEPRDRIVMRAVVPGPVNATTPTVEDGKPIVFYHEQMVDRRGNLRGIRVEAKPESQTIRVLTGDGQNIYKVKGFKNATGEQVIAALKRGADNRKEAARLKNANSTAQQHVNLANAMKDSMKDLVVGILQGMGIQPKQELVAAVTANAEAAQATPEKPQHASGKKREG